MENGELSLPSFARLLPLLGSVSALPTSLGPFPGGKFRPQKDR